MRLLLVAFWLFDIIALTEMSKHLSLLLAEDPGSCPDSHIWHQAVPRHLAIQQGKKLE